MTSDGLDVPIVESLDDDARCSRGL